MLRMEKAAQVEAGEGQEGPREVPALTTRTGQDRTRDNCVGDANAMLCVGVVGAETRRETRRELAAWQWDEVVDQRDQTTQLGKPRE